jgi:hypothetical protein
MIEMAIIDTQTSGFGALGSTTYKGSSSITLKNILSSRFSGYTVSEVATLTLQSGDPSNIGEDSISDDFVVACLDLSSPSIENLNNQLRRSEAKVDQLLSLADYGDNATVSFLSLSSSLRVNRAQEFLQLSISGRRITSYIEAQLPLCERHLNDLLDAETNFAKMNALNDAIQYLADAMLTVQTADTALLQIQVSVNPYL